MGIFEPCGDPARTVWGMINRIYAVWTESGRAREGFSAANVSDMATTDSARCLVNVNHAPGHVSRTMVDVYSDETRKF